MHIIFLGAGASAAEGAPIQSALIERMLGNQPDSFDGYISSFGGMTTRVPNIADFFSYLFGVNKKTPNKPVPTFEEALGILDYAIGHDQGLASSMYPAGNRVQQSASLEQVRQMLIDKLAVEVADTAGKGVHKLLCENLVKSSLLQKICFVTTNYDGYIDDALSSIVGIKGIDYGCIFDNANPSTGNGNCAMLLKLHGSLRWMHCDNCGATYNANYDGNRSCQYCKNYLYPLLVPPTYFKRLQYDTIASTWGTFRRIMRTLESVTFCGYSFPDADFHVKSEYKRAENISRQKLLSEPKLIVTVCNNYAGKKPEAIDAEQSAYSRFFAARVDYTSLSFEDFARNPSSILK